MKKIGIFDKFRHHVLRFVPVDSFLWFFFFKMTNIKNTSKDIKQEEVLQAVVIADDFDGIFSDYCVPDNVVSSMYSTHI